MLTSVIGKCAGNVASMNVLITRKAQVVLQVAALVVQTASNKLPLVALVERSPMRVRNAAEVNHGIL